MRPSHLLLVACLCAVPTLVQAEDWTRFRGPEGLAISDVQGLPAEWSMEKNLKWRTELPGPGTSSPIVVGDKIFLTSYTGYGVSEDEPGDQDELKRHVVCLSKADGKILWTKTYDASPGESKYQGNGARHGYSSSTATSDGELVYIFFGKEGVYAFDMDGTEVWQTSVGTKTAGWGSSNSPVLFGDLLIVNASIESGSIYALDKKTGKEVYQISGIRGSWNTPLLVPVGEATEMVISLPNKIVAYDPANGEELWTCEGIPDGGYVCPSVVAHDGVVYSIGGRKNTAIAVKAGGRGDVTDTHILWTLGKGSNVTSPVYYNGYLFWAHESRGAVYCVDCKTGELVYEERLTDPRPGLIYASAMAADGKVYYVSQHEGTYVLAAKPEFELLANNKFADDDSRSNASPVVMDTDLLLRSDKYLYCIGK